MIICRDCEKVLEPTNPSSITKKVCMDCVRKSAPMADMSKIMSANGRLNGEPKMSTNDYKRFVKKFSNMSLEHTYMEVDGVYHLALQIKDYHKELFMEFLFNKNHLGDFIKDIETLENGPSESIPDESVPEEPLD
jgi:hypothetical protein